MGVTAFECPGCGASLDPTPGHATVTCKYCQTTSRVTQPERQGQSPWNAHGQVHAGAADAAKRARKVIIISSLGMLVVSLGVAGIAAFSAAEGASNAIAPTATTGPAPSTPSPSTPSPAAAMDPAVAAENALLGRLDAYVRHCINRLDDRILSSRARYRSWVDDEEGPKANSRHVYGLYTFSDPSDCAERARAAAALTPRRPEMDQAGQAYVTAVTDLHAIIEEAERYYDRNDYQDDDMARGQELHGPLMNGFNRFIVAREALLVHVDAAFEEALSKREEALPPGDTKMRLVYDTMRSAQEIARTANVHWREIGSIDHDSFFAKAQGYQRQTDELANHVGEDERELQSYVQASQAFAQAAKEVARRVERGGGWSRGDRMMLRGVASHWMVTGSPGAALGKYDDVIDADLDPPLRYIAPTALLSDGY